MHIFIGADHRGFSLKNELIEWLTLQGYQVEDCGNTIHDPDDDYPEFAFAVAKRVTVTPESRGIVLCGSGVGVTIAANKVQGVRCATALNVHQVAHGRDREDMNVLALESDYLSLDQAKPLVEAFLTAPFSASERSLRRLGAIKEYEATHYAPLSSHSD